jgi:hypothetical protein
MRVGRGCICALLLGACATVESGGFKVDQADAERAFDQVRARAAWDFRCRPEGIEVVVLAVVDGGSWADLPAQIGATGCGRRGVYVSTRVGWVLNSPVIDVGPR